MRILHLLLFVFILFLPVNTLSLTSPREVHYTLSSLIVQGRNPDRPKPNQDACWAVKIPASAIGVHSSWCAGVVDGHGKKGHQTSAYLADCLPSEVVTALQHESETSGESPLSVSSVERAVVSATLEAQKKLLGTPGVASRISGSTACFAVLSGQRVSLANVGDSRAILGWREDSTDLGKGGRWVGKALTLDSTTQRPEERTRISGRIDGDGNVWNGPVGIAMTRALGDSVMSSVGVTAEPEVTSIDLASASLEGVDGDARTKSSPRFVLLATDGVWGVLSDAEAACIVGSALDAADRAGVCSDNPERGDRALGILAEAAREKWQAGLNLEQIVDDIGCVLVTWPEENPAVP